VPGEKGVVAAWRDHWNELTTFFKYPVELRRIIYTRNAIESLHSQMRKNISNRKVFPNDEAVIKILFSTFGTSRSSMDNGSRS
jgi:putative transposase